MKRLRRSSAFILGIALLAGCTPAIKKTPEIPESANAVSRLSDASVAELLRYSSDLLRSDPASRLAECVSINERYQVQPELSKAAHLFIAQLLSDEACGDIERTVRLLATLRENLPSNESKRLIELLSHLTVVLDSHKSLEQQLRANIEKTRRRSASIKQELQGGKTKAKLLQDKLDALMSIEQKLDERRGEVKP